jgi:tight adherence protein B
MSMMMFATIAVVGITFASVTMLLAAIGMFVRDLFAKPVSTARARLIFAPEEPEGDINRAFFRLVEESGSTLDMQTALAVVIGGAIIGAAAPLALFDNLLGAAGGLLLGVGLPILYFSFVRWWRLGGMRKQLPYALQAVADAVRGGQTLSEACELVSKETKGPLGREFAFAYQQLELGHSPISVMNRMVRRVPLPEFRIFATAVVVHRRAGGNLSLLTERMSKAAHDKTDVRNHVLAMTAGSRLSAIGMVAAAILAAVLLTWMQPEYVEMFVKNPKGPYLIATAILLQVIGAIWVWRILKTSV